MSADLSRTCPAGGPMFALTRTAAGNPAMGGTGLEAGPPGNDTARHGATRSDRNPPLAAGFALLGATNRDTARHGATAPSAPNCPKPVHEGAGEPARQKHFNYFSGADDGRCICLFYGRGLSETRVHVAGCPAHEERA